MNLFIADTHFGHINVLHFDKRPFSDVDEMWNVMKDLWNGRVTKKDDIWILGDFCFRNAKNPVEYLKELNGKKHLIIGNHDRDLLKNDEAMKYFVSVDTYKKIHDYGRTLILCHYPIAEWDGYFRGTYHIYGHIHNSTNDAYHFMKDKERALNAGCMINNYAPVFLDELINNNELFKKNNP